MQDHLAPGHWAREAGGAIKPAASRAREDYINESFSESQ
jgi:hypothetical protein